MIYCDRPKGWARDERWNPDKVEWRRRPFDYEGESDETLKFRLCDVMEFYKKLLGLGDWDIRMDLERLVEYRDLDTVACCSYSLSNKTAIITILHPADREYNSIFCFDLENDVVHELCHIVLSCFDECGLNKTMLEQTIEKMSRSLLTLRRNSE